MIQTIIDNLNFVFALKYVGTLNYFLGIKATKGIDSYHLCQTEYIMQLLDKVKLDERKSIYTPMKSSNILSKIDGELLSDFTLCRSLIYALQYCTLTRPSSLILWASYVNFMLSYHSSLDWSKEILLKYIHNTHNLSLLFYKSDSLAITEYCDAI